MSIHLIFQKYILAKLENLKPEMDQLMKELKGETAYAIKKFNWDEAHARHMFNRSVSVFFFSRTGLPISTVYCFVTRADYKYK